MRVRLERVQGLLDQQDILSRSCCCQSSAEPHPVRVRTITHTVYKILLAYFELYQALFVRGLTDRIVCSISPSSWRLRVGASLLNTFEYPIHPKIASLTINDSPTAPQHRARSRVCDDPFKLV